MNYNGWLQIVLTYDSTDCMTIYVENDFNTSEKEVLDILFDNYSEIAECLNDKTGTVRIVTQDKESFELSSGGGKVRSVIDKRIKP